MHKNFHSLQYDLLPAPPEIADLVDSCWQTRNESPVRQAYTVLPDGVFRVVLVRQPDQPPQLTLSGLWTRAFETQLAAQSTVLGIRFKPLAAPLLGSMPLLVNEFRPLPLLDSWLGELLLASPDLPTLAKGLASRLASWERDPHAQALFGALAQSAGTGPIAQVAAAAEWSPRRLNRYFQAQFGLPVKVYANVLRSYAAVQQLERGKLSAGENYYDQSHGIREIRKHTGVSPRQLDQQRRDRFIQLCPPGTPDLRAS